ncbi:peptidoglycan-binding domain-containing protein [Streptomyces sp. ME19-01-6]|uniref:peptidoglycan-binding domain-containing protein n=1 Tax=Streptomyces sp. ME19-01-6 TaxID=3028686 RepID=UPI0029AD7A3C|nr:peptidoglycan-binding domain-containing protein [Streptomyces sp. ME19-01-6]MDX3232170.1 peptidoglycan-binding domain-containing protein [Streptomyces sp. ME19-01-6]
MAAGTDPEQPTGRQVIEPTRIFRAVVKPDRKDGPPADAWMEDLDLFRPLVAMPPPRAYDIADADTEEFEPGLGAAAEPPTSAAEPAAPAASPLWRRSRPAALAAAGAVGAALALALVLLLPGADGSTAAQPDPGSGTPTGGTSAPASPTAPTASATPPGGEGREGQGAVLSLGDSGPEVSELQSRLLRIPDVYAGGSVNGRYDQSLASAVARFQLWYGIRGDEDGVYGDATRRDLESRT